MRGHRAGWVLVGVLFGALLGLWIAPAMMTPMVEYVTVPGPTVTKFEFVDRFIPVNILTTQPEREPTPHPTDCVVMRWVD